MSKVINRKELPTEIREAVKAVAGAGARKHKWIVRVSDSITIRVTYWDGGTRKDYYAATIHGQPVQLPKARQPNGHFSNPSTWIEPEYQIPTNVVVVEAGTFCGKTAAPSLTITRAMADRYGVDV